MVVVAMQIKMDEWNMHSTPSFFGPWAPQNGFK